MQSRGANAREGCATRPIETAAYETGRQSRPLRHFGTEVRTSAPADFPLSRATRLRRRSLCDPAILTSLSAASTRCASARRGCGGARARASAAAVRRELEAAGLGRPEPSTPRGVREAPNDSLMQPCPQAGACSNGRPVDLNQCASTSCDGKAGSRRVANAVAFAAPSLKWTFLWRRPLRLPAKGRVCPR